MEKFLKKGVSIYLLKVLAKYTDEDHKLTQNEIATKILEMFGVQYERKTIADTILFLNSQDFDIVKGEKKSGYYLGERFIEPIEFSFISDAIFSSRSISSKNTNKLIKKLSSCFSKYQSKNYEYIYKSDNLIKTKNEDIFLNIELIHDAIKSNNKITFNYCIYNEKRELVPRYNGLKYLVSPYFLVNNSGRYYLLCKYHRGKEENNELYVFRVDFITDIEIINERSVKIDKYIKDFSIKDYIKEHIYLFGGETVNATIKLENERIIHDVIDWFGSNCDIYLKDNEYYADIKCNENALLYWCLQYGRGIKVIEPESLVNKIKEEVKTILDKYK